MRNGQKRMRGRGNNNNNNHRRSHNPLTRVYESNGPDIKIRGTASHIAEKYIQLARDAQTSGDPVSAENYYQHAEHYFRLIAAAQEQFRQTQPYGFRPEGEARNDDGYDDDGDEGPLPGMGGGEPGYAREPQPYLPRESQPFPNNREQNYQPREQRPQHQPQHQQPQQPQPQPQADAQPEL